MHLFDVVGVDLDVGVTRNISANKHYV